MKKLLFVLLLSVVAVLHASANQEAQEQKRISTDIDALPIANGQLFLYSLDPKGGIGYAVNNDKVFHVFTILGKIEIKDEKEKKNLLSAFTKGIRGSNDWTAACFNPRHGFRLVIGSSTYDFVVCFECCSVMPYGFNNDRGFQISGFPSDVFNRLVGKYNLRKAD